MKTRRQEIIELMESGALSAKEISQAAGIPEKEVYAHLEHIRRSLKYEGKKLAMEPARCLDCGYTFIKRNKLTPPGRCPICRSSHIMDPLYTVKMR